ATGFYSLGLQALGIQVCRATRQELVSTFSFFFLKFLLSTTDVNGRPLNRTVVFRFKSLSSVHSPRFVGISWILGSSFGSMEGLRSLMPQILIRPSFRSEINNLV
ncbi:unnamed protein product, partial [Brassica rapa]